ncbi:hypothetical protein [Cysteiniphilum sp. 6C5]|uniref:hypothetical protein n=1 Tax=unclassified Cysteiniphilum TaxID=2610889 RepID=UPI003F8350BA
MADKYTHRIGKKTKILKFNDVDNLKKQRDTLIQYSCDDNHQIADLYLKLKEEYLLNYLSFYIIDLGTMERKFFCSNMSWHDYYIKNGMMNDDILFSHGFKMISRVSKSDSMHVSVVERWNNVVPITCEQKDVNFEKAIKGNFGNGIGHIQKIGNLLITSGFAGKADDLDFGDRMPPQKIFESETKIINELLKKN